MEEGSLETVRRVSCRARGGTTVSVTVTVEQAQARLREIIDRLAPGEEVLITDNQQRVAKLVGARPARAPRPAPGLGKGSRSAPAPFRSCRAKSASPSATATQAW